MQFDDFPQRHTCHPVRDCAVLWVWPLWILVYTSDKASHIYEKRPILALKSQFCGKFRAERRLHHSRHRHQKCDVLRKSVTDNRRTQSSIFWRARSCAFLKRVAHFLHFAVSFRSLGAGREQVSHVARAAHRHVFGNPFQGHWRLLPQPRGNRHLPFIPFALDWQGVVGPAQPLSPWTRRKALQKQTKATKVWETRTSLRSNWDNEPRAVLGVCDPCWGRN